MSDLQVLAHVVDILTGLLRDRGYIFEVEREYLIKYLDEILKREEADDERAKHDAGEPGGN